MLLNVPDRPRLTGQRQVILIVEDDPVIRRVASSILNRAGYTTLAAGNGVEAAAIVDEHPEIALVISDAIMPMKGGRALYDEARAHRPDLRFLFATGYSAGTLDPETMAPGSYDILLKPWHPTQLLERVAELLSSGARGGT